jgi:DNA-binding SARP family transcriptional activator
MPDEDGAPVVPIPSLAPDVGDDVPNDLVQAGGEIYTETLAELYAGQDAIDEAIEVYQKLIANDPHNEALTRRLTELETLLLGSERQTVPIESLAPEGAAG